MGSMHDWNLVNTILFDGTHFKKKILIFLYHISEERNRHEKYDLCNNHVYQNDHRIF